MNSVPSSQRLAVVMAGACNSGKSSLLNMLCGQDAALVSDRPGTTSDPVRKAVELGAAGACVLVDTAGLDDRSSVLGPGRMALSRAELLRADIVLLVVAPGDTSGARLLADGFRKAGVTGALVGVMSKADLAASPENEAAQLAEAAGIDFTPVSSLTGFGRDALLGRIAGAAASLDAEPESLLGTLVSGGDTVLLVMPQDAQAPKGRLILPQSLALRELLGKGCNAFCCVPERLGEALQSLRRMPDLVITDSQVFASVAASLPADCRLTSFSVLMAAYKGDLDLFVKGVEAVGRLKAGSRVLIAEACSHIPTNEDIGRVKLPRLLRKAVSPELIIDIAGGRDFPEDLSGYDLVVHCGGCMFTRRHVMERVRRVAAAGVAVTNYGILIARLTGILPRILLP